MIVFLTPLSVRDYLDLLGLSRVLVLCPSFQFVYIVFNFFYLFAHLLFIPLIRFSG